MVGTVLNEKLYIVGGYDWHLAEYSDTVYILQKKEKNTNNNSNNSNINNNSNSNNNNSTSQKNSTNSNNNNNNNNILKNVSNKGKISPKTEFKWILQESRLLEGRSSHACVTFMGKIWIAGKYVRS